MHICVVIQGFMAFFVSESIPGISFFDRLLSCWSVCC
jgi:hypothetical protein